MKHHHLKKIFSVVVVLMISISLVFGWGSWGHQHINHAAIFALPNEMRFFFL